MISIITPTYNRSKLIGKMIKSVIDQTYSSWELIIVDDGSTDNTEEVVSNFIDERIRYFKSQNKGATVQRNFGVANANGDFIIFLDSDDWVEKNWLEELTSGPFLDKKHFISTCGLRKINENGEEIERLYPEDLGAMFNNLTLNFLSGSLLYPKSYFLEVGGYDEELTSGQHTEILIRLLDLVKKYEPKIQVTENVLVNIFIHSGDRIRHNYDGIYRGSTRTLKKHRELFKKNPDKHFNYLSVAAVCAYRTGRIRESKDLTRRALNVKPLYYLSYVRFIIANVPLIANKIWTKK